MQACAGAALRRMQVSGATMQMSPLPVNVPQQWPGRCASHGGA